MIEATMYFALGLLMAGLLAMLVTPAIWRRAIRLTRQRIESSVPMTLAEIEADKDHLRAEFAMATRRLETTVDQLRTKATEQMIEVDGKRAEIVRLTNERTDQAAAIEALEQRVAGLVSDLKNVEERLGTANQEVAGREAALADQAAALAALQLRFEAEQQLTDEQKLELVARHTEIGNLNDKLADAKAAHDAITAERDRLTSALAAEQAALAAERRRSENLRASITRMEAERVDRLAELELRATEVQELASEVAKHRSRADDLAARLAEIEADRPAPQITVQPVAAEGDNIAKAMAAAEAEKVTLSARLAKVEADNAGLVAENAELRRMMASDRDVEAENSVLREKLASVAASVLRLSETRTDETDAAPPAEEPTNGNGSDERARVSVPLHRPPNVAVPAQPNEASRPVERKTLVERLRALQHAAVRQ